MIIDFRGNTGGGGGSGTTNYNELSNKPQINSVTLSGNVSSDQLGITPNELKAVENVPSAATNGSVFAEYREDEVGYGWQYDSATGTAFTFDISLNPYDGNNEITIGFFTYNGNPHYSTLQFYEGEDQKTFVFPGYFYVNKGQIAENQSLGDGLEVTVDYSDITKIVLTFNYDVEISNEITPASSIQVTKELKQAYNQEIAISRWDKYGDEYDGRYQLYQFKPLEGFYVPRTTTFIGQVHYYDIVIKAYVNTGNTVAYMVNISVDSGETWQAYTVPATGLEIPISLTGSSTAKVMNATFKAEYNPAGPGGDYGYFNIEADKFMWWDDLVVLTKKVLNYDKFLKEGEVDYRTVNYKPQINGVELNGNKSTDDLGLTPDKLLRKDNLVWQKEINATNCLNWANVNGIVVSIDWDGHSDMLLSFNWEDDWGNSGQTMYFSGGTWYNVPEDTSTFVLENGKLYFGYGGYGHLTSIAQGSLSSAVTFYKDVQINIDGQYIDQIGNVISSDLQIANGNDWYTFVSGVSRNVKLDNVSDGNLTINFGDNLEETVEVSGGQIVAGPDWTWESDHYYKYTPDLGKLMIFNYGSLYWEIRGGSGKLFINNPDVNGLASSISAKEAYEPMVGPYMYNGKVWRKI